jgi:L-asparaginase
MSDKKIKLISTGGTIAMGVDARSGGAVQKLSAEGLLQGIPSLNGIAHIEVMNFCSKPGPHMLPSDVFELSKVISSMFTNGEADGVVITHGTDTIEETAYALDLLVVSENPIIITGAMRNTSLLSADGPSNLFNSVLTAADNDARGRGTMVVFNNEVHLAREVTKSSATQLNTFRSPLFGPVGFIYTDKVKFVRGGGLRETIAARDISAQVELIKFTQGMSSLFFEAVKDPMVDGVVVEAAGLGHVSPTVAEKIQELVEIGKPVVITSRCYEGLVLGNVYAFEGSEKDLQERGVIFATGLSGQKARIKLILALSYTRDIAQIRAIFDKPIHYGC